MSAWRQVITGIIPLNSHNNTRGINTPIVQRKESRFETDWYSPSQIATKQWNQDLGLRFALTAEVCGELGIISEAQSIQPCFTEGFRQCWEERTVSMRSLCTGLEGGEAGLLSCRKSKGRQLSARGVRQLTNTGAEGWAPVHCDWILSSLGGFEQATWLQHCRDNGSTRPP